MTWFTTLAFMTPAFMTPAFTTPRLRPQHESKTQPKSPQLTVINVYGNIISMKEKLVKVTENVIYSTSTSSTMKEEDFRLLLVMDEYTLHASNVLKLTFIASVPDYPTMRDKSG